MKHIFKIFFLLFISGCSTSDDGMLCESGPTSFRFMILDKATGENIFESGTYESNQVKITNESEESVEFIFHSDTNILNVSLGWKEAKSDIYTVTIAEEIKFDIVYSLEVMEGGSRCVSTYISDLNIEGAEYETSETTGITKIFVMQDEAVQ